ncbi:MAG: YtxH domain-containing protein [Desulfobacterales bacterium]|jgi:gas vesicle protein
MVLNIIKAGGYVMILNELLNQVNEARRSRAKALRRNRTKNMIIGAGIGTAVGVAAGILFAPKSGKETRQIIADRTSETVVNLKESVAAAKERIAASTAEKSSMLREAGQKGVEAAKEKLKKQDEDKKKSSQK